MNLGANVLWGGAVRSGKMTNGRYLWALVLLTLAVTAVPATTSAQEPYWEQIVVTPGDYIVDPASTIPACGDGRDHHLAQEVASLVAARIAQGPYAPLAPVGFFFTNEAVAWLQNQAAQSGGWLSQLAWEMGYSDRFASCGSVTFVAPPGTHVVSIVPEAGEEGGPLQPCNEVDGQLGDHMLCAVGWSGWKWQIQGDTVIAVFKNWSGDRTRIARLSIYLQPN